MLAFSKKIVFHTDDTHKHYDYCFKLDRDYSSLKIFYSYYPKKFEDEASARKQIIACYNRCGISPTEAQIASELPLNNHITLSLTAPSGIVGTAHRHANNAEYLISPNASDYGFLPTPISSGIWIVTLSTHAILSPTVTVSLEAQAYD